MPISLIIVDDFLQNAYEVREAALRLDYPPPDPAVNYAGRNSRQRLRIDGLEQALSQLLGEALVPTPGTGHANCRIALAGDEGSFAVHVDESHWSGILYLNLPEHCTGGTDFFRHRATGAESLRDLEAQGFITFQQVFERIIQPDSTDPDKWEPVMRVPMRFNRLVLFRPWLWHCASPGFGDSLENGRLIFMIFLNAAGSVAAAPAAQG